MWNSGRVVLGRGCNQAWGAKSSVEQFRTPRKKSSGMATLAYDEILVPEKASSGMRTVLFFHGLLGSGRNWRTFAKRLASKAQEQSGAQFPGWRMMLVDLRNHGNSASRGFSPPHDMPSAARDVVELIRTSSCGWPDIVVSHSMGGKVALQFGQNAAAGHYGDVTPPKQLWILDSVPGKVPIRNSEGEVELVLSTILSLPDPLPSRRWLMNRMLEKGFSKSLSDWLGSNLKGTGSGEEMTWVFNPKEAQEMFNFYRNSDYWPVLDSPSKGMDIHIVRASRSDLWSPESISKLERLSSDTAADQNSGKVCYHVLQNAGHWLHVDNPEGLAEILLPSFLKLSK
ncbi:hypothetical protein Mapa_001330 [Marchantia paleacea]|nr:hypothetical protein Mapa_001330 [Marchantia paleacea]